MFRYSLTVGSYGSRFAVDVYHLVRRIHDQDRFARGRCSDRQFLGTRSVQRIVDIDIDLMGDKVKEVLTLIAQSNFLNVIGVYLPAFVKANLNPDICLRSHQVRQLRWEIGNAVKPDEFFLITEFQS